MARRRGQDAVYRAKTEGVKEAEKEVGKLEGALTGLGEVPGLEILGDLAGPAALGVAAGAIAKFLGDAAREAYELNEASQALGTQLQTTTEEASRFKAVFDDVGVEADQIVDIANSIEKALDKDADLAEKIGINLDDTNSKADILQAAIEAWNFLTPTERSKLFGDSAVADIARIAEKGESLQELLDGVSAGEVVDPEEEARMERLRRTSEDLGKIWDNIRLSIGEGVLSSLDDVSEVVQAIGDAIPEDLADDLFTEDQVNDVFKYLNGVTLIGAGLSELRDEVAPQLKGSLDEVTLAGIEAGDEIAESFEEAEDVALDTTSAIEEIEAQYDALTSKVRGDQAWVDLQGAFDTVEAKAVEAWDAAVEGAEDTEEKTRDAETATNRLKLEVIDYAEEVLGLPPERVTEILADINEGSIADAEEALQTLTRYRQARIDIETRYVGQIPLYLQNILDQSYGAGGTSTSGSAALAIGAQASANGATSRSTGASRRTANVGIDLGTATLGIPGPSVVNVNLPAASQGRDVVREIGRWQGHNGRP